MLRKLRKLGAMVTLKGKEGNVIAFVVDADYLSRGVPDVLEWPQVLKRAVEVLKELGDVRIGRIIVRQQPTLADVISGDQIVGLAARVVPGDADIYLAMEILDPSLENMDTLALFSDNENLIPALVDIKEQGKEIVLLFFKPEEGDKNEALRNIADHMIFLQELPVA